MHWDWWFKESRAQCQSSKPHTKMNMCATDPAVVTIPQSNLIFNEMYLHKKIENSHRETSQGWSTADNQAIVLLATIMTRTQQKKTADSKKIKWLKDNREQHRPITMWTNDLYRTILNPAYKTSNYKHQQAQSLHLVAKRQSQRTMFTPAIVCHRK